MNADLEMALNGSDADLRAFVSSLRAAPQARVRDGFAAGVMSAVEADARRAAWRRLFPFWWDRRWAREKSRTPAARSGPEERSRAPICWEWLYCSSFSPIR